MFWSTIIGVVKAVTGGASTCWLSLGPGRLVELPEFGEDAAELLHIGQAVFKLKGKITYFINTVFNYPTLAECYKTAAFNGLNRLS